MALIIFVFIYTLFFSPIVDAQSSCDMSQEKVEDLGKALTCELENEYDSCNSFYIQVDGKGINRAQRAGMSLGAYTATGVFSERLKSVRGDLKLGSLHTELYKDIERHLNMAIENEKMRSPEFLTETDPKYTSFMADRIFDRKFKAMVDGKYNIDGFQNLAQSYIDEGDPVKKAKFRERIYNEHIAKLKAGPPAFMTAESEVDSQIHKLRELAHGSNELSLQKQKELLEQFGLSQEQLDKISENIARNADPSHNLRLQDLKRLQREIASFKPISGNSLSPAQASGFTKLIDDIDRLSPLTLVEVKEKVRNYYQLAKNIDVNEAKLAADQLERKGRGQMLKHLHPPIAWRTGAKASGILAAKVGAHVVPVTAGIALANDVKDASAAVFYTEGVCEEAYLNKFTERDGDCQPVSGKTDAFYNFLELDWEKQKDALNQDPELCKNAKELYEGNVQSQWNAQCTEDGYSAERKMGRFSTLYQEAKFRANGEPETLIMRERGLYREDVDAGGFALLFKGNSPNELRYLKLDSSTAVQYNTGFASKELMTRISSFKDRQYYKPYPIAQALNEDAESPKGQKALENYRNNKKTMLEISSCCSGRGIPVSKAQCYRYGIEKQGPRSSSGKSRAL